RLESLVTIFQKDYSGKQEFLDFTLNEAIGLTESKLGYIYFYDSESELFTLYSWSQQVMNECAIENPKTTYNLKSTGIWGETVRQKKAIIVNDFQAPNPLKKGYPEGHAELHNFLSIPVIVNEDIVAVIGVANKNCDYNHSDTLHLSILMKNAWMVLQKLEQDEFIKKKNAELVKLNEDKDKFMSILAHDLVNPFNSLLGFSDLLLKNLHNYDMDKIEFQLREINKNANLAYKLLDDILTWSRAQAGKIVFMPEVFNLHQVCSSIIEEATFRARKKQICVESNISPEYSVISDSNLVSTVLRNLISNAIKFTHIGGTISINALETDNEIMVSVADTGMGIDKADLFKIFGSAEVKTTYGTEKEKGTGLGLKICHEFVKKMGGEIWVESELGKGSVFYFTIPKKPNTQAENEEPAIPGWQKKYSILVVDDEEANLILLEAILSESLKLNCDVLFAENGKEAVKYCEIDNVNIDLIFMDLRMPVMDGFQATSKIKKRIPETPVVIISANTDNVSKSKCKIMGCDDFIEKPIRIDDVRDALKKHKLMA
ncbi:MAG: hypothetical protein C0594_17030, partial [Marinilabiliales bacterium]